MCNDKASPWAHRLPDRGEDPRQVSMSWEYRDFLLNGSEISGVCGDARSCTESGAHYTAIGGCSTIKLYYANKAKSDCFESQKQKNKHERFNEYLHSSGISPTYFYVVIAHAIRHSTGVVNE